MGRAKRSTISKELKTRMAEGRRKSAETRRAAGEPVRKINPDKKPGPKTLSPETKTKLAEARRAGVAKRRAEGRPAYKTQAQHEASRNKRLADNAARMAKKRAKAPMSEETRRAGLARNAKAREAEKQASRENMSDATRYNAAKKRSFQKVMDARAAKKVAAGKKGVAASKAGTKAFRAKMDKQQKIHPPATPPAKSVAQTRKANIVQKFFGGSKKVPKGPKNYGTYVRPRPGAGGTKGVTGKGGGGGIGSIFTSGAIPKVGKRRPGQ